MRKLYVLFCNKMQLCECAYVYGKEIFSMFELKLKENTFRNVLSLLVLDAQIFLLRGPPAGSFGRGGSAVLG